MDERERVNILLVDDDPAKLLSYEATLSELGEHLITARSGKEALQHLLTNEIAVIVLDVQMPELDGFALAQLIREHPRYQETAIIFLSAVFLTPQDQLRGYDHGAVDYLTVPFLPELFRAKVQGLGGALSLSATARAGPTRRPTRAALCDVGTPGRRSVA
jgi:CheY-like chemotaxis protein